MQNGKKLDEIKKFNAEKLDAGERLVLCATRAILKILQKEGFKEAAVVGECVSALMKLPSRGLHLADIFAVLSDSICMKERTCLWQHLTALVEMLDELIDEAQGLAQPPPLQEPPSSPALCGLNSYSHVGASCER